MDKKRRSELITVKVPTETVFFFFNTLSVILKLSSCAYRKTKGFVLTQTLAPSAYCYYPPHFNFAFSTLFHKDIKNKKIKSK